MNFDRQRLHTLGERLDRFRERGVLLDHFEKQLRVLGGQSRPLFADTMNIFAMLGIGYCMNFIPVGLSCLSKKNERRRVSSLQAECRLSRMKG